MVSKKERERQKESRKGFKREIKEAKKAEKEAAKKALATKELVLAGLNYRVDVEVSEYPNLVFRLAPISDAEYSEVQKQMTSAIDFSKLDMEKIRGTEEEILIEDPTLLKAVDISKLSRGVNEAVYLALSYSLTRGMDEEWTSEDVGKLKLGVPQKLYARLDEISGISMTLREKAGFPRGSRQFNI